MGPTPPCPTGAPATHHALQVGLLEAGGFITASALGPKCRVCNWSHSSRTWGIKGGVLAWPGAANPWPGQEAVGRPELERGGLP